MRPRKAPNHIYRGAKFKTKSSGFVEVIKYNKWDDVDVLFPETGYATKVQASALKTGSIKDPLLPLVASVGFIGCGGHKPSLNGSSCKSYRVWAAMLNRCYNKKSKSYCLYGAKGVTVEEHWHNYQNFAEWYKAECTMLGLSPFDNSINVDKDILSKGVPIYSSTTCLLVTSQANCDASFAKEYWMRNPEGMAVKIRNMAQYCKGKDIIASKMRQVHNGERKSHKGWTKANAT